MNTSIFDRVQAVFKKLDAEKQRRLATFCLNKYGEQPKNPKKRAYIVISKRILGK
jgi:hypothetical protein